MVSVFLKLFGNIKSALVGIETIVVKKNASD